MLEIKGKKIKWSIIRESVFREKERGRVIEIKGKKIKCKVLK